MQALFKEISENVGDQENEWAMRWWYENRELMGRVEVSVDGGQEVGKGKGKEKEVLARL